MRRAISVVACLRLEARQTPRLCVSQPDAGLSGSETLVRNLAGLTKELFVAKYFIGWCRPAIPVQLAIHTFKLMNEYFWYVGGHQLAHRDECKVSSNNDRRLLRPGLSTSCRLEATIRKIAVIITTLQQISALQAFDSSSSSCCCCRSWHFVQLCLFISFARGKDC